MPNQERAVHDRLQQMELSPYLPRVKVQVCHAGRVDWVYRPFLPRYLFVEQNERVSAIKRTTGVSSIVRAGDGPALVRQVEIDRIKQREVNGFIELDSPPSLFPGNLLRVAYGQWANRDVIFHKMKGELRALVFLEAVMGRIQAEVSVKSLRAA